MTFVFVTLIVLALRHDIRFIPRHGVYSPRSVLATESFVLVLDFCRSVSSSFPVPVVLVVRPRHGTYSPRSRSSSYSPRSCFVLVLPSLFRHSHPLVSSRPHPVISFTSVIIHVALSSASASLLSLISSVLASALASSSRCSYSSSPRRHDICFRHCHPCYLFSSYSSSPRPIFEQENFLVCRELSPALANFENPAVPSFHRIRFCAPQALGYLARQFLNLHARVTYTDPEDSFGEGTGSGGLERGCGWMCRWWE